MREIVKHIVNEMEYVMQRQADENIARNAFLFTMASVTGVKRAWFKDGNERKYANFFGITIAPSGEGKDLALSICESMFRVGIEKHKDIVTKNFEELNGILPDGTSVNDEVDYMVPQQYKVALEGTPQGMMRIGNFYNRIDKGSLNVVATELGHELGGGSVLPVLTKLWQTGSTDGSTNVNEKYPPIKNVPTNILIFGSPAPFRRRQEKHAQLVEAIEAGLARRSFFVWSERDSVEKVQRVSNRDAIVEYGSQIEDVVRGLDNGEVKWDQKAKDIVEEYREKLMNEFNEHPSEWFRIKMSNVDKVKRAASMIAIAGLQDTVRAEAVIQAIEMANMSDRAMESIIMPEMPYLKMYKLLTLDDRLSITEMIEAGIGTTRKREVEDNIELLEDYAYRKDRRIVKRGAFYSLEDLPVTDMNKIIVSVDTEGKGARGLGPTPLEIPFFGEKPSIETLVTSEVDWFSFVHFDGKRNHKNAIEGQNCIAFDVDNGMTVEEAIEVLTPYTYIIYTTRNHGKDKNGVTADRFRVILPTKQKFYASNERHKIMMENIANAIALPSIDVSTRNIDRLWFPSPSGTVYKNQGMLIDVTCCLPDTEKSEAVQQQVGSVDATTVSDDRRIQGMIRWTLTNAVKGGRNNTLMRLHRFVKDVTGSKGEADAITRDVNLMLLEPLDEIELERTVCR